MEKYALVLIVLTNVFLVFILAILVFLIYRIYKQDHPGKNMQQNPHLPSGELNPNYHPAIVERLKEVQKLNPRREELFCPNHPDEPGETTCAICDHLYCNSCIKPYKALHFCNEHMPLIMNREWNEVMTLKTSTQDPENGVRLYDIKKEMYQKDNIPTYIETHYKINVDQDYIETYLVLFAAQGDEQRVRDIIADSTPSH